MTNREEIERLLQKTGRTLEGLPKQYKHCELMSAYDRCETKPYHMICHQSDVIELLVGALRDALDKPMQKPLTLEEVKCAEIVWLEDCDAKEIIPAIVAKTKNIWDACSFDLSCGRGISVSDFNYNILWRAWVSRPTDEEREAAAWES